MIDDRGGVFAEYVVVLSVVSVVCGLAILGIGVSLARLFAFQQMWLTLPFP